MNARQKAEDIATVLEKEAKNVLAFYRTLQYLMPFQEKGIEVEA